MPVFSIRGTFSIRRKGLQIGRPKKTGCDHGVALCLTKWFSNFSQFFGHYVNPKYLMLVGRWGTLGPPFCRQQPRWVLPFCRLGTLHFGRPIPFKMVGPGPPINQILCFFFAVGALHFVERDLFIHTQHHFIWEQDHMPVSGTSIL